MTDLTPSHILQIGMGFFASKTLLSAVELKLFTALAKQPMTGAELARSLEANGGFLLSRPIQDSDLEWLLKQIESRAETSAGRS